MPGNIGHGFGSKPIVELSFRKGTKAFSVVRIIPRWRFALCSLGGIQTRRTPFAKSSLGFFFRRDFFDACRNDMAAFLACQPKDVFDDFFVRNDVLGLALFTNYPHGNPIQKNASSSAWAEKARET